MNARISITDDHVLFVDGLSSILNRQEGVEVVFTSTNGSDLIKRLQEEMEVDLVFLDLEMPEMDGLETLRQIRKGFPDLPVLMLSMHHDEAIILHLIQNGASGYLLKNSSVSELQTAISEVMKTGIYFDDFVVNIVYKGLNVKHRKPIHLGGDQSFSSRELTVLELLCKELTAAEIAEKLCVSQRTVEGHKRSLMEKTKSKNTAGLIVNALKLGLIQLDEI